MRNLLCDPGGLRGIHRTAGSRGFPYLEVRNAGSSHVCIYLFFQGPSESQDEYFCSSGFSDLEATVFCRMLSWNSGKVSLPPTTYTSPEDAQILASPACTGSTSSSSSPKALC